MLFGGKVLCQPAFVQLRHDRPEALKVVGEMLGSDEIMSGPLFLGTYPGLTQEMLKQERRVIANFLRLQKNHPRLQARWDQSFIDMNIIR